MKVNQDEYCFIGPFLSVIFQLELARAMLYKADLLLLGELIKLNIVESTIDDDLTSRRTNKSRMKPTKSATFNTDIFIGSLMSAL